MFFGVKRERELFVLSEGLVKMSDDVFRGMHPKKKNLTFAQKQTKQGKKANLLSVSFSLFSLLSFLSKFPHNEKLLPFLKVALVFI